MPLFPCMSPTRQGNKLFEYEIYGLDMFLSKGIIVIRKSKQCTHKGL